MNRSSFAFFVALLIHLVLFLLLWLLLSQLQKFPHVEKTQEKKIKISLKELPKKQKKNGEIKKKMVQSPIAPPMPKGAQLKKIVKKEPIKYEPKKQKVKKVTLNKVKKIKKKSVKKKLVKKFPLKENYIPIQKEDTQERHKKDPLAWMYEDKSAYEKKTKQETSHDTSSINQDIKKLYGEEFGKLTKGQQKYLLDNQEIMRRITQQVLNRVARVNISRDLHVNRDNIIEFYLHPNGDMTDFKFLSKSGYYVLDETTKETIEYAYSKYPRPKEKILIRYKVFYNLAY